MEKIKIINGQKHILRFELKNDFQPFVAKDGLEIIPKFGVEGFDIMDTYSLQAFEYPAFILQKDKKSRLYIFREILVTGKTETVSDVGSYNGIGYQRIDKNFSSKEEAFEVFLAIMKVYSLPLYRLAE